MTTLANHQFEILPATDAADGEVFGIGAHISMNEDGFHPGSTDWANQDSQSSLGHINFGRDAILGPVWAWDLHVNRDDEHNALESLAAFTTAWRALHLRRTPGKFLAIRYMLDDRVRRIYGRPGLLQAEPNNLILSGYTDVTCDFQAVDAFTYADVDTAVTLTVGEADEGAGGGGFSFPLTFPVQSQAPTEQQVQIVVGGDAPTSPIIRFDGPVTNPRIETDNWAISLNYDLPAGQYVEIDTRPWAISVMLNGTTPIPGVIGRRQNLSGIRLEPGVLETRFLGFSNTGTATCQIRWWSAFNSI